MAVVHRTTLTPSKLDLLTAWLPTRAWYVGGGEPRLARAGGFRLDDPEGEVGLEFMVVTDIAPAEPVTYFVPLTYRGAPLEDAEHAQIGTMEHGVLGRRWAYDGAHDPVSVAELLALIEGRAQAQAQGVSDTPDHDVTRAFAGGVSVAEEFAAVKVLDDESGTELVTPSGAALRLRRVLSNAPDAGSDPAHPIGEVGGIWLRADGSTARGRFAVLSGGADAG